MEVKLVDVLLCYLTSAQPPKFSFIQDHLLLEAIPNYSSQDLHLLFMNSDDG